MPQQLCVSARGVRETERVRDRDRDQKQNKNNNNKFSVIVFFDDAIKVSATSLRDGEKQVGTFAYSSRVAPHKVQVIIEKWD